MILSIENHTETLHDEYGFMEHDARFYIMNTIVVVTMFTC